MLENILLDVVKPLLNAGEYFVGYFHALVNEGEYFVGYCLPLVNAGEYFIGYCHASSGHW